MKKNSYLDYLTNVNKKIGPKSPLSKRTVQSIIHRTNRIEKIINQNLDSVLDGESQTLNELLIKYEKKLNQLNHSKIYKSALFHCNDFLLNKKKEKIISQFYDRS